MKANGAVIKVKNNVHKLKGRNWMYIHTKLHYAPKDLCKSVQWLVHYKRTNPESMVPTQFVLSICFCVVSGIEARKMYQGHHKEMNAGKWLEKSQHFWYWFREVRNYNILVSSCTQENKKKIEEKNAYVLSEKL